MKILITGGHMSPALAMIDYFLKNNREVDIVFVGRKYTEGHLSLEYKEVTKRNVKFINLNTGRLTRIFSYKTFMNIFQIHLGFIRSLIIINNEKPNTVLSFGGYLALPISIIAWMFRIPIYTHEQTIRPGLANRVIGFFAKKIFISFEESKNFFNQKKIIITGNPVRLSILNRNKSPFNFNRTMPVIYITGGSLGSHSINEHIKNLLPDLLKKYIIIHQTGDSHQYHDFEKLTEIRDTLTNKNNYYLIKHFSEDQIGYIYSISDLVIGRAGANTFFELLALKKPTIFIPLPWSGNNEQEYQAKIFADKQIGEIFYQNEPSKKLFQLIDKIITNIEDYKKNFSKFIIQDNQNATKKIYREIFRSI